MNLFGTVCTPVPMASPTWQTIWATYAFQHLILDIIGYADDHADGIDIETGLPWFAIVPEAGDFFDSLGTPSSYAAVKMNRAAVCYLWYRVKKWKVTTDSGVASIDIEKCLFQTNPVSGFRINPYQASGQSFFFPLDWYDVIAEDVVSLTMDITFMSRLGGGSNLFFADGLGNYFPRLRFTDIVGTDTFTINDNTGGNHVSDFLIKNELGHQIAKAPIFNTTDMGGYSDVIMEPDTLW